MITRTLLEDGTISPVRRWRAMDEFISCLDRFDRGQFLDRVTTARARLSGDPADADAWAQAADLDDDELGPILDAVAPLLVEFWDDITNVTVVERPTASMGHFAPVDRDPFARPDWWPIEPTREDEAWKQRRNRIIRLFAELLPEEQADVLAAAFEELRRTRSWAPDVRRFLETGEQTIDTVHFVVPLLEAKLFEFGHTDATWEDLT